MTTPASGAVFTYTNGGDGVVYTISAANVNDAASGSETQTTAAAGGSSGNGANTSPGLPTETGSSAGGSTKTGWGSKLEFNFRHLICAVVWTAGYVAL